MKNNLKYINIFVAGLLLVGCANNDVKSEETEKEIAYVETLQAFKDNYEKHDYLIQEIYTDHQYEIYSYEEDSYNIVTYNNGKATSNLSCNVDGEYQFIVFTDDKKQSIEDVKTHCSEENYKNTMYNDTINYIDIAINNLSEDNLISETDYAYIFKIELAEYNKEYIFTIYKSSNKLTLRLVDSENEITIKTGKFEYTYE